MEALDLEPSFRDQPDTGVTYAEKIGPEDRRLDPELGADLLERRVRALTPHIGAYVELPWDERLGVTRAALAPGDGPPPGELAVERRPPALRRRNRRARAAGGAPGGEAPDGRGGLDSRLRRTARPGEPLALGAAQ